MKTKFLLPFVFLFFLSCSYFEDGSEASQERVYEFSWCSYEEGFQVQDLNNELIAFIGFLKNLKEINDLNVIIKYLNPALENEYYDFTWLDIFENDLERNAYYDFADNSEIFKNWLSSKDEIITCDTQRQSFYEKYSSKNYLPSDGDQTYVGFCKLKDGYELNSFLEGIKEKKIFREKTYNKVILLPKFDTNDFDFLIFLETNFFSKDLNLIKQIEIQNACKEIKDFPTNSLLFSTYVVD